MHSLTRASFSLRISTFIWNDPARLSELMAILPEYRDTLDEVALFTAITHPPQPLAVIEERAQTIAQILPQFRTLGFAVGINHLATIGHLDENLPNSLGGPFQRLMDIDGKTCQGSFCPNDTGIRDYISKSYQALAASKPDFIWVDDDLRMESHTQVGYSCFCERCLAQFSSESGKRWTREELKAAFKLRWLNDEGMLRRAWLAHTRGIIADVLALIRQAVDSVTPGLPLGWMGCENLYSGYDVKQWIDAGELVRLRPGGGFYEDFMPTTMLDKANMIGRQLAGVPTSLTNIQSEHENFPYQMLKKSATIFGAEIGTYIAAGCSGTALNCMGITDSPFDEYLPRLATAKEWRPFSDLLVQTFGRSPAAGIWYATSPDAFSSLLADGDWLSSPAWGANSSIGELAEIGIPVAYEHTSGQVTVFAGDFPLQFSDDELREMLSGGVMMDGQAAQRLEERGFAEQVGFRVAGTKTVDTIERFTDDPLNGRFANWDRDCRPSFWMQNSMLLEPTGESSRALSRLHDFAETDNGIVSGVAENSLGGRVAVFGYYPWTSLQTLSKTAQQKSVLRWLSRDTLPAYIASYHKAALWVRHDASGTPAYYIINASLDPADDIILAIAGDGAKLTCTRLNLSESTITPNGIDDAYRLYQLPTLGPWESMLVRVV